MIHFLLLLICIVSIEVLILLNFLYLLDSIVKETRKVTHVILQKSISDHWKEKVIPAYALRMMKYSIQMFSILLLIISLFLIADYFFNDFFDISLSLFGVLESMIFAFAYVYSRKLLIK